MQCLLGSICDQFLTGLNRFELVWTGLNNADHFGHDTFLSYQWSLLWFTVMSHCYESVLFSAIKCLLVGFVPKIILFLHMGIYLHLLYTFTRSNFYVMKIICKCYVIVINNSKLSTQLVQDGSYIFPYLQLDRIDSENDVILDTNDVMMTSLRTYISISKWIFGTKSL